MSVSATVRIRAAINRNITKRPFMALKNRNIFYTQYGYLAPKLVETFNRILGMLPEDSDFIHIKQLNALVEDMKYEYLLCLLSYRGGDIRDAIREELQAQVDAVDGLFKKLYPTVQNHGGGYRSTMLPIAKKEEIIKDFREKHIGTTTFYATKAVRLFLEFAAFIALIYLGVELAAQLFPEAGTALHSAPWSDTPKTIVTSPPFIAALLTTVGIAAAYKWSNKIPGWRSVTGVIDYSLFNAFTSHQQLIAEKALEEAKAGPSSYRNIT